MSVYLNGTSDNVRIINTTTLTVGTGSLSVGMWVYTPSSLPGSGAAIFYLTQAASGNSEYFAAIYRQTNTSFQIFVDPSSESSNDNYTPSTSTWYWLVISRSGTTGTIRLFDDSTSTTPLQTATVTSSTNWTTMDSILIGGVTGGDDPLLMRITNLKIQTGVEWTNAECRTEALYYGIQKSGGTDRLCWRLKDIDADTDGLNEFGGAGPNFTNSGAVTDAAMPTNLSEAGGGGSIGFDDGDGPVGVVVQGSARQVRLF